jgi:Zn finger protein HypA/HybF involved in hydrogenase expression
MRCEYCNQKVEVESNYCSHCGAPILDFISYPNHLYTNLAVDMFHVRLICGDCETYFWTRYPGVCVCPHCSGELLVEITSQPVSAISGLEKGATRDFWMQKVQRYKSLGKIYECEK